ncbi:MFS transporter [Amycolatopsis sp. NPDC051071]|uniref:MFS transporter n=1 Tax=Amycolatopsis sp. NPDC051071 TaxID=3154637 RepID=UPI003441B9B7
MTADAASSIAGLGARLDRLRWGRMHRVVLLALGAGWMFDSLEVNLVGSVISPLDKHFQADYAAGQFVIFSWLIGVMIGALVGGRLADRFGRRRLFVLTLLWYVVFTVLTGLAPTLWAVIVLRFVTALGVGAEYPVISAAVTEFMPARYRGKASATVMNFWPLGAILAGLLAFFLLNVLALSAAVSWRFGFILGGVLALLVLFFRRRLPESPRWLASQGRYAEAEAIVRRMEEASGGAGPPADTQVDAPPPTKVRNGVAELMRRCPGRLALGSVLNLSEAFGAYGINAFMPLIVLPAIHVADSFIPVFYILGSVGALIGGIVMSLLIDSLGRHKTIIWFYTTAGLAVLLLAGASSTGSVGLVLVAFMLSNGLTTGAGMAAYPVASELFPTELRGIGVGFSVAVGRIGAAFGVTLITFVATHASITAAYIVVVFLWLIGAGAMVIFSIRGGVDGAGRPLDVVAA